MKAYERKQLLARLEREGATVGARIPERIEVQGDPVDLRAFVFETKRHGAVPPGERERVEAVKRKLRRERRARRRRLEDAEISREEGEALVERVIGIDRALNALSSLDPTDLEADAAAREAADQERWITFLKQVLGRDDGRRSRP